MRISIVTTLYYSENYIEEFIQRIEKVIESLNINSYEIICVDDGSPDNSRYIVETLAKQNENVKLIELSKNFGHYKAIMTGLKYATGEDIFLIDSDLEEEPELLIDFISEKNRQNADVVYGVQEKRKGGFFERVSGHFFYKISNVLCDGHLKENAVTARLMSQQYIKSLLLFEEKNLMIFGVFSLVGYKQVELKLTKYSTSPTTYSLNKKINLMIDNFIGFSSYPLKLISSLGFFISIISFIYIIYIVFGYYLSSDVQLGWSSVVASIWLLGWLILLSIGTVGLYVAKIFLEVKSRPLTIIKNKVNMK